MLQEFIQEIENTVKAIVNDVHTALPGEIVSYDAMTGTATVSPIGKFVTSDNRILEYPKIAEVPVVFPYCSTAEAGIILPVKPGDSCIVIVSEVELDEWRSGAESDGPLRFDLTNAVVIPGLLKKGKELHQEAVDKDAVVVVAKEVTLSVSKKCITARGDFKVDGDILYTGSVSRVKTVDDEEEDETV